MPKQPQRSITAKGAENAESTAGEETVVVTMPGVTTTPTNNQVTFKATASLVTEAEGEEVTMRIRRTGVTGAEVGKVAVALGASAKASVTLIAEDNPGEVAGMTYVLTLQEKKATKKVKAVSSAMQVLV